MPSRRRTALLAFASAVAAIALLGAPAVALGAPAEYTPGADGVGDPYFPLAGNGGIDVVHYDLDLDYTPAAPAPAPLEGRLDGVAVIDLLPTQDLSRFNLDLRGLTATAVTVAGKAATFTQTTNELVITPTKKVKSGKPAQVVVTYGGTTIRPTDIEGALYGWVTTRDGAMVVSEPDGSATWFPVNDHPTDKATYTFEITVPEGLVAVANGLPTGPPVTAGGRTTWNWDAPDPMAAYLATASVGDYVVNQYTAANGTPIFDAVDPTRLGAPSADLAKTSDMLVFFESLYGPYPFNSYGAIVDDDSVGYALETQTRSFFSRNAREGTVAHELAHQWMGDHVSPSRWADIWLNEGWATYSEWMWTEHRGGATAQESFDEVMSIPADDEDGFWEVVVADPGPLGLFLGPIYDRGAATLHALRAEIGDEAFFEVAQAWVERFGGGTASTTDFIALSEEISGQDLGNFFEVWLSTPEKPVTW
jgi:aminopeptidase N